MHWSSKYSFVLEVGFGHACVESVYSSNHREHNNEKKCFSRSLSRYAAACSCCCSMLRLLMNAVHAATAAVVLLLSLPPAAGGSGAVFVRKTVCTRAVVVVCLRVTNARYENAAI